MKMPGVPVFLLLATFLFVSHAQAFSSIHPNFKGKFSPERLSGAKLSITTKTVPTQFKAFIPPGAEKATIIIYGPKDGIYGAMSRVDNPPQCVYEKMSKKKAKKLPWRKLNTCSLYIMRKQDCQRRNTKGQITVFSWEMGSLSGKGVWVYVSIKKYSDVELEKIKYTVHVDRSEYDEWYGSASWSGKQPSGGGSGPTGGHCDPAWSGK